MAGAGKAGATVCDAARPPDSAAGGVWPHASVRPAHMHISHSAQAGRCLVISHLIDYDSHSRYVSFIAARSWLGESTTGT
jgi:hypothetical protein